MQSGNHHCPLHDEHDPLTNRDKVEAEMFNAFLALVFNTDDELWNPQALSWAPMTVRMRNSQPRPKPEVDLLLQLVPYRSMGPG